MRLEDGTMVCCFDLKKSRNDWRICELVIILKRGKSLVKTVRAGERKFFGAVPELNLADAPPPHRRRQTGTPPFLLLRTEWVAAICQLRTAKYFKK
jgi:hypothetical protein